MNNTNNLLIQAILETEKQELMSYYECLNGDKFEQVTKEALYHLFFPQTIPYFIKLAHNFTLVDCKDGIITAGYSKACNVTLTNALFYLMDHNIEDLNPVFDFLNTFAPELSKALRQQYYKEGDSAGILSAAILCIESIDCVFSKFSMYHFLRKLEEICLDALYKNETDSKLIKEVF